MVVVTVLVMIVVFAVFVFEPAPRYSLPGSFELLVINLTLFQPMYSCRKPGPPGKKFVLAAEYFGRSLELAVELVNKRSVRVNQGKIVKSFFRFGFERTRPYL